MFSFKPLSRIFRNLEMQIDFEKNGYVVVEMYSHELLSEVISFYHQMHQETQAGFYPSAYSEDKHYRNQIDKELTQFGKQRFDELFQQYQIMNGCFIVKQPGYDSYLHVHQDMTLVDESNYVGINIWTTTVDLTPENGVLYLLPGSHRFFPTYRGHTIPGFYDPIQEEIKDYMVPLYLKAGQAIIFDQSIVHFSPPNLSDKIRIVTNVFVTNSTAQFRTCYHDKNDPAFKGKVELFEQEKSFMTDYEQFGHDIFSKPKQGVSLGLVKYEFPQLTLEMLENKFKKKQLRTSTPSKIEKEKSQTNPQLPLWKIYSPMNVVKEIVHRIKKILK